MREAADDLCRARQLGHFGTSTGALVETLLTGAGEGDGGDIGAAAEAVARLAAARGDEDLRSREINLLRWRAMLARARGDQGRYGGLRDRYRAMAASPGFEGHIAWAAAMT